MMWSSNFIYIYLCWCSKNNNVLENWQCKRLEYKLKYEQFYLFHIVPSCLYCTDTF